MRSQAGVADFGAPSRDPEALGARVGGAASGSSGCRLRLVRKASAGRPDGAGKSSSFSPGDYTRYENKIIGHIPSPDAASLMSINVRKRTRSIVIYPAV